MPLPDVVKTAFGGVHDHDLTPLGQGGRLSGDRGEGVIEACLILADDDDGDHR